MFVPHFAPGDNRNYLPENWVPHVALAVKLTHEQFEKGMEFLKDQNVDNVKIVSIGLAKCNPYTPVAEINCK